MKLPDRSGRLTVLYDADCGFCQHCARVLYRLDKGRRLRLTPLQLAQRASGQPA